MFKLLVVVCGVGLSGTGTSQQLIEWETRDAAELAYTLLEESRMEEFKKGIGICAGYGVMRVYRLYK